jgi:hypothetical protein
LEADIFQFFSSSKESSYPSFIKYVFLREVYERWSVHDMRPNIKERYGAGTEV